LNEKPTKVEIWKFGGTSMKKIDEVANLIIEEKKQNKEKELIVICSAFSRITDFLSLFIERKDALSNKKERAKLIDKIKDIHQKIVKKSLKDSKNVAILENTVIYQNISMLEALNEIPALSAANKATALSIGEKLSCNILMILLLEKGIDAHYIKPEDVIKTKDNDYFNAEIDIKKTQKAILKTVIPKIDKNKVVIVPGFIGSNSQSFDNTVTLGRDGSDLSASIMGSVLKNIWSVSNYDFEITGVVIWTDVDGWFSANPEKIKNTTLINRLTYKEAQKLSTFGTKVLHQKAIPPAMLSNIKIVIKNTFNPHAEGTIIHNTPRKNRPLAGLTSKDCDIVTNESPEMAGGTGYLYKIYEILYKENLPVDVIATDETVVSSTINPQPPERLGQLVPVFDPIASASYITKCSIINLTGEGLKKTRQKQLEKILSLLNKEGIEMIMHSYPPKSISIVFVIYKKDKQKVLQILHKEFFENPSIN